MSSTMLSHGVEACTGNDTPYEYTSSGSLTQHVRIFVSIN